MATMIVHCEARIVCVGQKSTDVSGGIVFLNQLYRQERRLDGK